MGKYRDALSWKIDMERRGELTKGAGISPFATEVEVPAWIGEMLHESSPLGGEALLKGAGHKYIRRVPTGDPKKPWRYYYTVQHGAGLGHESEMVTGAKFKMAHGGREGHFEVLGKDEKGNLRIRHDESGHEDTVSASALREMLHREHAVAITSHREKLKRDLEAASKHGSPKQKERLQAEAKRAGVETEEAKPEPVQVSMLPAPEEAKRAPFGAVKEGRRVYLPYLPFELKDWAKEKGAKWDVDSRRWYFGTQTWEKVESSFAKKADARAQAKIESDKQAKNSPSKRIYLTGSTYSAREQIKRAGGSWDAEKKAWWISPESFRRAASSLERLGVRRGSGGSGGGSTGAGGSGGGGMATPQQVDYAHKLVRRLVQSGGWFDSQFGDGRSPPSKADLEGMTSKEISEYIDDLKTEF